jgi:hypothetical protein
MSEENVWEVALSKYKKGDIVELDGVVGIISLTHLQWNTYVKYLFCDYYGGANLYNLKTNKWAKVLKRIK